MSMPRVLFVEGDGASPPGLLAQRTHPDLATDPSPAPLGHWAMWRLLSGNNRELGRSASAFADVDSAIAAVVRMRSGLHHLVATDIHDTHPGRWSWLVTLDDEPIARSTRSYQRLRECRYSLAGFMEGLPIAHVVTDPDRIVRQRRPHQPAVEPINAPLAVLR